MKAKKIVRYRLPVSVKYPATHKRAGEPTYFVEKILNATISCGLLSVSEAERLKIDRDVFEKCEPKAHTIRGNYNLWAKRFEKIQNGEAVLELYYWSGKPYNSKCVTVCQLGKEDGVGIQMLELLHGTNSLLAHISPYTSNSPRRIDDDFYKLAKNDGLSLEDFEEWFRGYDLSNPMAIIHFTNFRY